MLRVEQRVARREGQPVFAADDLAFDDLDRKRQLVHHRLDDGDLLEIFFPEVGARRAYDVEQPADDLRHAVEVTGACGALHHLVDLSEIELTTVRFGVYLLDRRHQHEIRAGPFQQTRIGLRGAGIMSQVVFVVELGGIDEDAHHDGGVLPAGALDQRAVSRMQGAHRRDEPDSGLLRSLQLRAELFDACEYFHLF